LGGGGGIFFDWPFSFCDARFDSFAMKKALILIIANCVLLHSSVLLAQKPLFAVETTTSATPSAAVSTEELPAVRLLPDNPFYFLKTLKEKIQLAFARGASAQADLLLDFSQKRLAEALRVAEKGKVHISEKLFEAFGKDIEMAQEKIATAKAKGERTYGLLVKLQETVVYQKEIVGELQEEVEGLEPFLVEVPQELEQATESGRMPVGRSKGPGIIDWLKGLFGKKEILSPLAR